jgi:signal transduction histidine kinase
VDRAVAELDNFSARMATLRVCDSERPVSVTWNDIMARVASRCDGVCRCTIEASERTRGPFRQRAELLGRTLFHLVRNAMEASPRGALVRIRVDESRLDGARLFHVRVTDEGTGVEASLANEIWKPYVTSRRGHAGLGLAYVATSAPLMGAVLGMRREAEHTVLHMLLGEEGGLQWE